MDRRCRRVERVKYTVAEAASGAENLGNGNPEEGGVVFLCFAALPLHTLFLFPFVRCARPRGGGRGFRLPLPTPGLRCPVFASGVVAPSQKADRCPCSASAVSAAGSASASQPLDSLPSLTNRAALARRVQWTKQPGRSWRSAPVFASALCGAPQKSAKRKRIVAQRQGGLPLWAGGWVYGTGKVCGFKVCAPQQLKTH